MSTIPKTDLHVLLISSLRRVQVITIAGPESASRSNFDARVICQRIQESPAARGFIPEAIYQVDIPNTAKVLKSLKGLSPSTSTPVVGPLQQQFFANIQPGRIYLAAYLKASPAAAVAPKRKPSADIKRDDAKKSCNTHTTKAAATRRHVNLTPVDVGIKGYDRHPLYITGRVGDRVQLSAPCSDFRQQLYPPIGHRYLFPDFSLSIRELLDSSGDNTLGVYTPMPSDLDAASFSSMLTACVDISSEEDYPETIGKLLEIAPHESAPSSYPHSKDFVMEFDFTDFAFDSLTSKMFKKRLHQRIKSGVEDFITKYDKWLHFGHAGTFLQSTEGSGRAALVKVLQHIERRLDEIGNSRVFMIIHGYDALRNLGEVKSLRTSESPTNRSDFPSPQIITDLFKEKLYNVVFQFQDRTGTISKIFLFGTSPAFSAELRPSTSTDLAVMGVLGLAGVTASQVQAYLSVAVGDKPPVGMDLLVRTVCQLLPGYVYASTTPPQYPRRLLHKLLPALKELRFERNSATIRHICGPLVNDVVDLNMFMAARTLYVRGRHLWHSHIDDLRLQRRVAMSPHAKRFRHRYHDFQADQINATSSMKDVFVPVQPDPFFAYCVDAGLLTVSFDTPDKAPDVDFCYQFPGHSVYRTFRQDIIDDVDQSGLAVRQPFDGSPEWIFDAMDPYLKNSRSTLSNANAPENTFQSIRTSIMHMAEAHTGAHTYDAVMEAEMGGKHRADSVVLLPQRNATIVIEDKTIRLFDFLEGTMGIKLERWPDTHTVIESKLTKEHWRQAEALAAHLRKLHPRVFTETEIPDKDIPNASTVPFRTFDDLPTELRHFFFMGWVNKVYGRHSIFSLLSSAECQGRNYELDLQCGQVNDERFDCRECRGDKKNFITVIVVIVVGGVRVLARRSRLTTNKRCSYYLVHTGKNPS